MAAAMALTGGVLVAISVDQHHRRTSAISAQDRQRQEVDRRAAAEAQGRGGVATTVPPAVTNAPSPGSRPPATSAGAVSSIEGAGAVLVVPALAVRAPIVAESGLDGSMVIPSDIQEVGWYDGIDSSSATAATTSSAHSAPWPGQPGVAVLAGHVDWAGEGPGALYYLGQLRVGDPIQVVGSNGVTTSWRVSQPSVTLSKSALPSSLFDNTGPPALALVTCGGPFDSATGHYLDNVIVWAAPS